MTLADTASATMYFEQFYLGCLAHASYLLGSEGEAAVVDPQRDVEIYLKAAQEHGLKIRHIFGPTCMRISYRATRSWRPARVRPST